MPTRLVLALLSSFSSLVLSRREQSRSALAEANASLAPASGEPLAAFEALYDKKHMISVPSTVQPCVYEAMMGEQHVALKVLMGKDSTPQTVASDPSVARELRRDCAAAQELHKRDSRYFPNCLRSVPEGDTEILAAPFTYRGRETLKNAIFPSDSDGSLIGTPASPEALAQGYLQLLEAYEVMLREPARAWVETTSYSIIWNGKKETGKSGLEVSFFDLSHVTNCENALYQACVIDDEMAEDEYWGPKYLMTARDLGTLMILWSTLLPKTSDYDNRFKEYGLRIDQLIYPDGHVGPEPGFLEAVLQTLADVKGKKPHAKEDCIICMQELLGADGKASSPLLAVGHREKNDQYVVRMYTSSAFMEYLRGLDHQSGEARSIVDPMRRPLADSMFVSLQMYDEHEDLRGKIEFVWMSMVRGLIEMPPRKRVDNFMGAPMDTSNPLWDAAMTSLKDGAPEVDVMRTILHTRDEPEDGFVEFIFRVAQIAWKGMYVKAPANGKHVKELLQEQHTMLKALLEESVYLKNIRRKAQLP